MTAPDHTIRLINAFPSIVGEVQLSHSAGNEVLKQPVTFVYQKWLTGASGGVNLAATGGGLVDTTEFA